MLIHSAAVYRDIQLRWHLLRCVIRW